MRRLRALLDGLPADAAWRRTDPAQPGWDVNEHLLARLVEATEHLAWLTATVNSPKNRRPKHPAPVPRPKTHAAERKQKTDWRAQLRASGAVRHTT